MMKWVQLLLPLPKRQACCGCQREFDVDQLQVDVKHFGKHSSQYFFCSQECKEGFYHRQFMHNLRGEGL